MEQYGKHHCIEPKGARKLFIQLDKTTYSTLKKNNEKISLHICQPNAVIKLNEDQLLTLLSLKGIIEETICYLSHSTCHQETAV